MVAPQASCRFLAGLPFGHAVFDGFKITHPAAGLPLGQIDPPAGQVVAVAGLGDLHIAGDLVMEAQIFIDIGGDGLGRSDGADDGGRAGSAVAAGEHAGDIGKIAETAGVDHAFGHRHAGLLEMVGLDALADGGDQHGAVDELVRLAGGPDGGAAVPHRTDHLRRHPHAAHMPVFIDLDGRGRLEGAHFHPFGHGGVDLAAQGRHIGHSAAVNGADLGGAQPPGRAHGIHGHVAAADDGHLLAGQIGLLVFAHVAQEAHGRHDPFGVFVGKAQLLVGAGADGDEHGVILLPQLLDGDVVADAHPVLHFDPGGQNGMDVVVQPVLGQPVVGDAVAQHAAQLGQHLKDGDGMAHQAQVIGCRQAAGATADHGHTLAGVGRAVGRRHSAGTVGRHPLESADIDGVVDHIAAAPGLAGMLADIGAGGGEGIVLADQPDGVLIASGAHQRDIAGDIDGSRAQRDAGHRLAVGAGAASVADMLFIVLPAADQAFIHHVGGLIADGAVGRMHDRLGRFFQKPQGAVVGAPLQNVGQQVGKLDQADAAGRALAAALGVAKLQKSFGDRHRTQARRRGFDPAFQIFVKPLDHQLRPALGRDLKSAQILTSLCFSFQNASYITALL